MTDIVKREIITLGEVKAILNSVPMENMDQIQRWTYDYVMKFSKVEDERAKVMVKRLIEECELKEEEAVEVVNIMPSAIEEVRAFTFGWKKLILTETLEKILKILKNE